jgi:hypothetical protein
MTVVIDVLGWIGAAALLAAYWLVSTEKATGNSRTYQGMNLAGAVLVLSNSLYHGALPSVGVNAIWIVIGAYAIAKQIVQPTNARLTVERMPPGPTAGTATSCRAQ